MPVILVHNDFPRIAANMRAAASTAVKKTIARIHEEVNAEFTAAKTGAVYGDHQASAPGEPPAIDTGYLQNSIEEAMIDQTTGVVAVGADYGLYLEMGTVNMAPRPFMVPAAKKVQPEFLAAMKSITK